MELIAHLTTPEASAKVYQTGTMYAVVFGYMRGERFEPSTAKPTRAYVKQGAAFSSARAWVS